MEDYAATHNLPFLPAGHVHERRRMPLFCVSLTANGKGGVLVYLLNDAVRLENMVDDYTHHVATLQYKLISIYNIIQWSWCQREINTFLVAFFPGKCGTLLAWLTWALIHATPPRHAHGGVILPSEPNFCSTHVPSPLQYSDFVPRQHDKSVSPAQAFGGGDGRTKPGHYSR
jgi:hypothetical protein